MFKTSETLKENFNKQLIEQREVNSGLNIKVKTEIESVNKIKIVYKENQDEITRVNESRVMSKDIEEEKERMTSGYKENIIGSEPSKEKYGKKVILQRHENNESPQH